METPHINMNLIAEVVVVDPDSLLEVNLSIYKMATGPIVGIDSSYLATEEPVRSPYDNNFLLVDPEDSPELWLGE